MRPNFGAGIRPYFGTGIRPKFKTGIRRNSGAGIRPNFGDGFRPCFWAGICTENANFQPVQTDLADARFENAGPTMGVGPRNKTGRAPARKIARCIYALRFKGWVVWARRRASAVSVIGWKDSAISATRGDQRHDESNQTPLRNWNEAQKMPRCARCGTVCYTQLCC